MMRVLEVRQLARNPEEMTYAELAQEMYKREDTRFLLPAGL